jgi:hypothetical protein
VTKEYKFDCLNAKSNERDAFITAEQLKHAPVSVVRTSDRWVNLTSLETSGFYDITFIIAKQSKEIKMR